MWTLEKLDKLFRKLTNTDYNKSEVLIPIGYVYPIDMYLFLEKFMNIWVESIDEILDGLKEGSLEYADIFGFRAITLHEFLLIKQGTISKEKIQRRRVYDYVYVDDSIEQEEFITKFLSDDISARQAYKQLIAEIIQREIPLLEQFLLRDKKIIYHPVKNFNSHTYLLAMSNYGKSEILKSIIFEIQRQSQKNKDTSIVLLEPHKDLSLDCLQYAFNKNEGFQRLVYLDPNIRQTALELIGKDLFKEDYTFSLNPFEVEYTNRSELNFMIEHLASAWFSIIDSTETFQMEAIIEAALAVLIKMQNSDIADLQSFMVDTENAKYLEYSNKNVKSHRSKFLSTEFQSNNRIRSTRSSIYFRLQTILGKELFMDIISGKSTVNLKKEMNSGKVIIANFSKSSLGGRSSIILGKLFNALVAGYAEQRQSLSKKDRVNTFFIMDEFQNYIEPEVTGRMFSESRKYAMNLICVNQQIGQLSSEIRDLIAGNTAIKFCGDNEPNSIEYMMKQMKGLKNDSNFDLPKHTFYFYDKYHKDLGSFMLRSSSYLIDKNSAYYLNKKELENLFKYMAYDSGYYKKIETRTYDVVNSNFEFKNDFAE